MVQMVHIADIATAAPPLDAEATIELAHHFCEARSHDELRDEAIAALRPYGFKGLTLSVARRVKNVYLHAPIFSTWPRSLQDRFERRELFDADPVIQQSRVARGPFVWGLSIYDPADPQHASLIGLRHDCKVTGGVVLPVFEAFNGRSVLYLSGAGFDTTPRTLLCLQMLAEHLSNRANALGMSDGDPGGPGRIMVPVSDLSPRERQVFGWIAFGKSSREIAVIMGISEHTVNDYIASAVAKLKAANRTEALLRALLTNQIPAKVVFLT
jgi:LuxR family transcriptional regulator, quorum-sensing system regulator BjaR1